MSRPEGFLKDCEHCGKQFYVPKWRAAKARFCSMECLWAGRRQNGMVPIGIIKTCESCGQEFYVPPYREAARFCSKRCAGLAQSPEKLSAIATKHGGKRGHAAEYRAWLSMKMRCEHQFYYVANAIKVCYRWANSFPAFLADMGPKPSPEHTLDRYPSALGDYEPGNCRWATHQEQGWSKRGKKQTAKTKAKRSATIRHGLVNGTNSKQKLTVANVREIRRLQGIEARSVIAARFGINIWHVRDIQERRAWAWLPIVRPGS